MVFFSFLEKNCSFRILGDRIILEPLRKNDIVKIRSWFDDRELISLAFGLLAEEHFLDKLVREYLNDLFSNYDKVLGIWLPEDKLIGFVNYAVWNKRNCSCRMGVVIGSEEYRSLGYGTEAVNLILFYLFEKKGFLKVNLDTANFNERAQKCFARCGFKKIRDITDINFLNDQLIHKYEMSLNREEFLNDLDVRFKKTPMLRGRIPG